MPPAVACPKCKHPLTIPQPAPESMACPHCQAILRFEPAKSAVKAPAAVAAASGGGTAAAKPAVACPKCKHPLTIPQPAPETMACPHCHAILRFAPAKSAAKAPAAAAAAGGVATATARLVAGYELQRELARGGLGVVFLAYHPRLKHYRAVKRPLPRADIVNDVLLARFQRETEALATLESKHIIRVYDADTDADGPYILTEYLDGESLSNLVARHGPLPVSEACELVRQVALGLQSAHECGLVHRDIKPSNLMLAQTPARPAPW